MDAGLLDYVDLQCPYCWESFQLVVDTSAGDQDYVEDCEVCCQPITLALHVDPEGHLLDVEAQRENG